MEHVQLGSTGLRVSQLCLGMMSYGDPDWQEWMLSEDDARPFVQRAAEAGITFFDTADVYSRGVSEEITGRLLRETFPRRSDFVLATKVFGRMGDGPNDQGLSRGHIMDSVDASLHRLGVDHIDLYQIHRWDPHTPIAETMEALHDVVRAGKVRYIGASSMWAWQFAKAQYTAELHGWTRFVTMQNQYSLVYREEEREMIPFCSDSGVGLLPWSPLARGLLAGSRTRDGQAHSARARSDVRVSALEDDQAFDIVDRVGHVAKARGAPSAQVALAWLLSKPAVTAPIIGATKVSHLDDAVAATELTLSFEEIAALEEGYHPRPVVGHE